MTDIPQVEREFEFGPSWSGNRCCGKPVGCTNTTSGCRMLGHPWKRRMLGTGGRKKEGDGDE